MEQFMELIKWKNSQGLVFWMYDDYDSSESDESNQLVKRFWVHFSNKLCNLYDPITKNKYNPLQFDRKWWKNVYDKETSHLSKFNVDVNSIVNELCLNTIKYKCIQEIIYQSNPDSLNPIISYNESGLNENKNNNNNANNWVKKNIRINTDDEDDGSEWFISPDYDENELNENDLEQFMFTNVAYENIINRRQDSLVKRHSI